MTKHHRSPGKIRNIGGSRGARIAEIFAVLDGLKTEETSGGVEHGELIEGSDVSIRPPTGEIGIPEASDSGASFPVGEVGTYGMVDDFRALVPQAAFVYTPDKVGVRDGKSIAKSHNRNKRDRILEGQRRAARERM